MIKQFRASKSTIIFKISIVKLIDKHSKIKDFSFFFLFSEKLF